MIKTASRLWTPRPGHCEKTAFRTGVDRALAQSFPLAEDAAMPERIAATLRKLEAALNRLDDPHGR